MPFFFFLLFHVWQESCKNFSGEIKKGKEKKIQKKQKGKIKAPHLQSKEGIFFFFFSGYYFFFFWNTDFFCIPLIHWCIMHLYSQL